MEYINKYVWFQEGPGIRKKQYTENGVKLLNVANLINGKIDLSTSKRYISKNEAYGKYKHFLVDEGDFIIASSGIQVNYFDKKMGLITKDQLPLCMNTSTIRFKTLDKNKLDIRYFMYFMKSEQFKLQLKKLITGSAQLNFGPSHLKKVKISVPELKIQKEYISKLDNITKIIDIKNKQIMQLNQLIKSLFVDMFNKYEKIELHFIANIVMGQSPKSSSYNNNNIGTPFFQGKADYGDKYTIIKHWTTKPCKLAQKGNVLMSVRAPVGPVNIASHNCCIGRGLCAINSKPEKANNEFLYNALKAIQNEISSIGTGSTFKAITKNEIYNIKLPNAPIEKQDEFTKIVNQIDKQKFEIQKKKQVHIKIGG